MFESLKSITVRGSISGFGCSSVFIEDAIVNGKWHARNTQYKMDQQYTKSGCMLWTKSSAAVSSSMDSVQSFGRPMCRIMAWQFTRGTAGGGL